MRRTATVRGGLAALALGTLVGPAPVGAQTTILSNLAGTNDGFIGGSFIAERRLAQGFTMGATGINLTSVELTLSQGSAETPEFQVSLFGESGGLPSAELADLGTVTVPTQGNYTFSGFTPFALNSGQSYFIVARTLVGDQIHIGTLSSAASDIGALMGILADSLNGGASWNPVQTSLALKMDLQGASITAAAPEPGSLPLLALGAVCTVAGIAMRRRRHRGVPTGSARS